MTALPLALSLSSTFTKIGALAAFAALVGIAVLALLVFSQARELKRLREWAGRAPERAADLEQRVTSAAASRLRQPSPAVQQVHPTAQAAPIQASAAATGGAGPATRVLGTPVPSAVPAGQAQNTGGPQVAPTPAAPGVPLPPPPVRPSPAQPVAAGQPSAPAQPQGATPGTPPSAGAPAPAMPAAPGQSAPPAATPPAQPPAPPVGSPASAAGAAQSRPGVGSPPPPAAADPRPPAPATAAAAAAAAPRAPVPPPPATPAPAEPPPAQPAARRPPAPASAPAARRPDPRAPILAEARRSTYTAKRSPRRTIGLVVGGLVVLAAVVVAAVTVFGGSSSGGKATTSASGTAKHGTASHPKHPHKAAPAAKTPAVSPAETTVAVLNATEAEGLAHRTASALQQNGYSQATALNGKPPGSGQVSVVEYASGHQAEAEGVARSAAVSHVEPMESAVAALANSASVVLIVGADKVTQSP